MLWVAGYLLVGYCLAEGTFWYARRTALDFKGGHWVGIILIWPVYILVGLYLMWKRGGL